MLKMVRAALMAVVLCVSCLVAVAPAGAVSCSTAWYAYTDTVTNRDTVKANWSVAVRNCSGIRTVVGTRINWWSRLTRNTNAYIELVGVSSDKCYRLSTRSFFYDKNGQTVGSQYQYGPWRCLANSAP